MRIIIDILHPAHVHFFRNFIEEMGKKGHNLLVTTRNKDITLNLLDEYKIRYKQISKVRKGSFGRIYELITRSTRFYKIVKRFKPDLLISEQGPTTSLIGRLLKIPNIIFWDTEVSTLTNFFCYPLADAVYTPISYQGKVNGNHINYNGYQKLAYLHPNRFKPNINIKTRYNLPENYTILRLVSWTSNHDKGDVGFTDIVGFVEELEKHSRVYISSEEDIPETLKRNEIKINYKDMHDVLAFASLYVGESATMANEAAILGVPSIYLATSERGYINELQNKYEVVFWFKNQKEALLKSIEIVGKRDLWKIRRDKMLINMVDLTEFMINIVENKKWVQK